MLYIICVELNKSAKIYIYMLTIYHDIDFTKLKCIKVYLLRIATITNRQKENMSS